MKQLEKEFNLVALEYVTKFAEKHHLTFNEWEDEIGSIAVFNNCKSSLRNIMLDINRSVPRGVFLGWHNDYSNEASIYNPITYSDYLMLEI